MTPPLPRVEVSRERGVATLTMHGHKSVNLISRAMMDALLAAGAELRNDAELRLIVLTGAGMTPTAAMCAEAVRRTSLV